MFLKLVPEEIIMLKLQGHKISNIVFNFFQPSKVRINIFGKAIPANNPTHKHAINKQKGTGGKEADGKEGE